MGKLIISVTLCAGAFSILTLVSWLSSDAIAMALGVIFGIAACIPVSLMIMAVQRSSYREGPYGATRLPPAADQRPPTPPVIIIGGSYDRLLNQNQTRTQHEALLPGQRATNDFRRTLPRSRLRADREE